MPETLWSRLNDGTYVTEMSEFMRTPKHPVSGDTLGEGELKRAMTPHIADGELKWWYGSLDDGTRLLIYND